MVQSADKEKQEFAKRLAIALERIGVTRYGAGTYLKKLTGTTVKTANNWLNGEKMPRRNRVIEISKNTGVRTEWLEYGVGSMTIDQAVKDLPLLDEAHSPDQSKEIDYSSENEVRIGLTGTASVQEQQPQYPHEKAALDYHLLEDCIEDIEAATIMLEEPLSPKLKSRAIAALYQHRLENGMQAMPNDVGLAMSIISSLGS